MYNFFAVACFYFVAVESWYALLPRSNEKLWQSSIIQYNLNTMLSTQVEQDLNSSMQEFHEKTCVRFRKTFKHNPLYMSIENGQFEPDMWSPRKSHHRCISPAFCRSGKYGNNKTLRYYSCTSKKAWVQSLGISLGVFGGIHRHDQHTKKNPHPEPDDHIWTIYNSGYRFYDSCQKPQELNWTTCCYCEVVPQLIGTPEICDEQEYGGLSVLDADTVNQLYDCKDCYRHRWRSTQLYYSDIKHKTTLYSFGSLDFFGREIFPCRALVLGEYAVGMYTHEQKTCIVPSTKTNSSLEIKTDVELLLIPNGVNGNDHCYSEQPNYENRPPTFQYDLRSNLKLSGNALKEAVPAGNIILNEKYYEGYIAFGSISAEHYGDGFYHENIKFVDVIGTAWNINGKLDYAVFPIVIGSKTKIVKSNHFKILICKR